jgi:hypothetical protein
MVSGTDEDVSLKADDLDDIASTEELSETDRQQLLYLFSDIKDVSVVLVRLLEPVESDPLLAKLYGDELMTAFDG